MKIFGIAMNYKSPALEGLKQPVVFLKADSSLLKNGKPFFIPDFMGEIDYETEIVVRICKLGKSIPERFAHRYYDAVTVGIDFTARRYLQEARQGGLPWDICKGFDGSAVIGEWVEKERLPHVDSLDFKLDINGTTVQESNTCNLIFKVDQLISYISQFYTLKTGDIIFTGTPAGVSDVHINDHLEGYVEGRKVLDFYCK